MESAPRFAHGHYVRKRSEPDQAGLVRAAAWNEQREEWEYTIQFGNSVRAVLDSNLDPVGDANPWADLANGRLAGAAAFREAMTYQRLNKPPGRIAASFGSARTIFYPYQFKPLLKLLDHPSRRVLVADDVGLGKTIEAGYILRELDSHEHMDHVLVIVPARLTRKWQADMQEKFSESFDIVRSRELRDLAARVKRQRTLPPFRWITSYESARSNDFIRFLEEVEPSVDLLIVDEAHRVRNPATKQARLVRALANAAQAMVFLTATPIQTRRNDLFELFRLLDRESFSDPKHFDAQMEANRPIVQALTHLRSSPPRLEEVLTAFDQYASNPFTAALADGPFFRSLRGRVADLDAGDRAARVELQRDIAEMSLTASILSRTRKVEVMKDRPQRKAFALTVELSETERAFYNAVADICRRLKIGAKGWGENMGLLMAYRYTASCIPAARKLFQERLGALEDETEDDDEDDENWESAIEEAFADNDEAPPLLGRAELRALLASGDDDPTIDAKFDKFLEALRGIWADDKLHGAAPRKIVVFAFFKRTLAYLSERLRRERIGHEVIHGGVDLDTRHDRIESFATEDDVLVLLASEVGGEGIDLQFSSVVVNYDLPWNPMTVEQRIGRVDRIGQRSPTITVLNLAVNDSIETRILMRLYDRVKLFEGIVGEIEPIVGEQVFKVTVEALSGRLTVAEQEALAEKTALTILNNVQQAEKLNNEADALLATDQAFLDEVESLVGQRRMPTPEELREFVTQALARKYHGCVIPPAAATSTVQLRLVPEVAAQLRAMMGTDPDAGSAARKIEQGDFVATFSPEIALRHPRATLIHARHPLVRMALGIYVANKPNGVVPFDMRLIWTQPQSPDAVATRPIGSYVFAITMLEFRGVRPRSEISSVFMSLDGSTKISGDDARALIGSLLDNAEDVPMHVRPTLERAAALESELNVAVRAEKSRLDAAEKTLNAIRHERRVATLKTTLDLRVQAAEARLDAAQRAGRPAFTIKMDEAKLTKALRRRTETVELWQRAADVGVESEQVAIGIVHFEEVP